MSAAFDPSLPLPLGPDPAELRVVLLIGGSGAASPEAVASACSPEVLVAVPADAVADLSTTLDDRLARRALDLVVDDGTHRYGEARAAFEQSFGRLRPGGRYVLRDWAWAHTQASPPSPAAVSWVDEAPALTNLVVELVMLAGSDPGALASLEVDGGHVVAVRGAADLGQHLELAHAYRNRGLPFRPLL